MTDDLPFEDPVGSLAVVCIGFASLDVLAGGLETIPPAGAHTVFIDRFTLAVGGDATNQSLTLARLGRRVRLLTLLGRDVAGDVVVSTLDDAGVDTSRISRTSDRPTSVCLASIRSSGDRSFVAGRSGTAATFGPADLADDPLPERFAVLSIGSLNCSRALDTGVLPGLAREARARGALVVADMVTDHLDVGLDDLRPVLEHVDYLMPSEIELAHFTGHRDPVAGAAVMRAHGVGAVVVKQGSAGATLVRENRTLHQAARPTHVVDTTGAGDSFVAGFISGLVAGVDEAECLRWGSTTAALSVTAVGATNGIPRGIDLGTLA